MLSNQQKPGSNYEIKRESSSKVYDFSQDKSQKTNSFHHGNGVKRATSESRFQENESQVEKSEKHYEKAYTTSYKNPSLVTSSTVFYPTQHQTAFNTNSISNNQHNSKRSSYYKESSEHRQEESNINGLRSKSEYKHETKTHTPSTTLHQNVTTKPPHNALNQNNTNKSTYYRESSEHRKEESNINGQRSKSEYRHQTKTHTPPPAVHQSTSNHSSTLNNCTQQQHAAQSSSKAVSNNSWRNFQHDNSYNYHSEIEKLIINSKAPIPFNECKEEVEVNGIKGILLNKGEILDWEKKHGHKVHTSKAAATNQENLRSSLKKAENSTNHHRSSSYYRESSEHRKEESNINGLRSKSEYRHETKTHTPPSTVNQNVQVNNNNKASSNQLSQTQNNFAQQNLTTQASNTAVSDQNNRSSYYRECSEHRKHESNINGLHDKSEYKYVSKTHTPPSSNQNLTQSHQANCVSDHQGTAKPTTTTGVVQTEEPARRSSLKDKSSSQININVSLNIEEDDDSTTSNIKPPRSKSVSFIQQNEAKEELVQEDAQEITGIELNISYESSKSDSIQPLEKEIIIPVKIERSSRLDAHTNQKDNHSSSNLKRSQSQKTRDEFCENFEEYSKNFSRSTSTFRNDIDQNLMNRYLFGAQSNSNLNANQHSECLPSDFIYEHDDVFKSFEERIERQKKLFNEFISKTFDDLKCQSNPFNSNFQSSARRNLENLSNNYSHDFSSSSSTKCLNDFESDFFSSIRFGNF
jgi:hypothetical protein